MRLFVAVELPEEIRTGIEHLQRDLKSKGQGVRWVQPRSIHCTLKFLGDVAEEQVPSLVTALTPCAERPPFTVGVRETGVFPRWSDPRVIWVGVAPVEPELAELQRAVEHALVPLGFPREEREFHPHLTLGRVKQKNRLQNLVGYIREIRSAIDLGSFPVDEFVLFQSILRPEGAEYRAVHKFKLRGDGI